MSDKPLSLNQVYGTLADAVGPLSKLVRRAEGVVLANHSGTKEIFALAQATLIAGRTVDDLNTVMENLGQQLGHIIAQHHAGIAHHKGGRTMTDAPRDSVTFDMDEALWRCGRCRTLYSTETGAHNCNNGHWKPRSLIPEALDPLAQLKKVEEQCTTNSAQGAEGEPTGVVSQCGQHILTRREFLSWMDGMARVYKSNGDMQAGDLVRFRATARIIREDGATIDELRAETTDNADKVAACDAMARVRYVSVDRSDLLEDKDAPYLADVYQQSMTLHHEAEGSSPEAAILAAAAQLEAAQPAREDEDTNTDTQREGAQ